jgi:hypothetical protein
VRRTSIADVARERVVVPERDLVRRGRVVLVDDRHGAEREQLLERVARVDVGRRSATSPP